MFAEEASRLEPLEIITVSGAHRFEVELAKTAQEREKGLMFRRSMPRNQGMLFDFRKEDMVLMWMKDTYIPLDMVFVSRGGRVISVAHDAEPMSNASSRPVRRVMR